MAHPQHQYPPRQFSPLRSTSSPHPGPYLPPSKRQRLSPNPPSYPAPSASNNSLPNQMFSSPNFGAQPNGNQARLYDQTSAPSYVAPSSGVMGPPLRPVDKLEKPTDVNDLSDVLIGSGVDLKEEEAALLSRFNDSAHLLNGVSSLSDAGTLFSPSNSSIPKPNQFDPYKHINTMSQNVPGDKASFYGAGTFNQPAVSEQKLEEEAEKQRRQAVRRISERKQYHLNDPFLSGGPCLQAMDKHTQTATITIPREGLLTAPTGGPPTRVVVAGPDNHEVLKMLHGQDLLYSDRPLTDILTLLSLAAQERLRTIVEDSATLAKGRRSTSHGVVPPDLADLATGQGIAEPATALLTPIDSAVSPKANPLKRSFSESNHQLPSTNNTGPSNTVAYPNLVIQALRKSAQEDRTFEEQRLAKRAKRTATNPLGEASRTGFISSGTPGTNTPGPIGDRAPEIDVKKLPSRKEQKRQADAKASEVQQHADMTKAMDMALGVKKRSWLTKGSASSGSNFPVPPRVNTNLQHQNKTAHDSAGAAGSGGGSQPKIHRFGDFREDKELGRGLQMRDVLAALEPNVKEVRSLAKAYIKLGTRR